MFGWVGRALWHNWVKRKKDLFAVDLFAFAFFIQNWTNNISCIITDVVFCKYLILVNETFARCQADKLHIYTGFHRHVVRDRRRQTGRNHSWPKNMTCPLERDGWRRCCLLYSRQKWHSAHSNTSSGTAQISVCCEMFTAPLFPPHACSLAHLHSADLLSETFLQPLVSFDASIAYLKKEHIYIYTEKVLQSVLHYHEPFGSFRYHRRTFGSLKNL